MHALSCTTLPKAARYYSARRLFRQPVGPVSSPRPDTWLPCVFTDIDRALEAIR